MKMTTAATLALLLFHPALASDGRAEKPFILGGKTWQNQKAFVESGARCATRHVDAIETERVEKALRHFEARHANRESGGPGGVTASATTATVVVPVYVHVINNAGLLTYA